MPFSATFQALEENVLFITIWRKTFSFNFYIENAHFIEVHENDCKNLHLIKLENVVIFKEYVKMHIYECF